MNKTFGTTPPDECGRQSYMLTNRDGKPLGKDMNESCPLNFYGIRQKSEVRSLHEAAAEEVRDLGYTVLNAGYTDAELQELSLAFDRTRLAYIAAHGKNRLKSLDELNTIRAPLTHGDPVFLELAFNKEVLATLNLMISGKYILNQQNGIINPPKSDYNQGAWHRDLPYQHFTSSRPLAINALFCLDDFTVENGGTFVLPASHKAESLPSDNYILKNSVQISAKAGSFILLDCMTFHCGGKNKTSSERRAVNHIYNIPYFKQQINIPANIGNSNLSPQQKEILGFDYGESNSIEDYLSRRIK